MEPIVIAEVKVPGSRGVIGIAPCPGRIRAFAPFGAEASRDLDEDLKRISRWGAELLVTLLEPHEMVNAGVADLPSRLPAGMRHLFLPIRDMGVPDPEWERRWSAEIHGIRELLARGGRLCVHCMGGMGRSGTVAARILIDVGMPPGEAVVLVRTARPGAIETTAQEAYLEKFQRRP